jgi:hypothetical protein
MMPKAFGGMRGNAAPIPATNGTPGGIRPRPRPEGLGGVEVEQQPGFLARQFGAQGSDARYEMAMQMLQAAMAGAQGSNSPALAFLAPIIGATTGAKLEQQRSQYLGGQAEQMTTGLLGGPLNPQAQQALEVLNNPNAPDYLKQIASTMFKQNAVPVGQMAPRSSGGGGQRRSSGGGSKGGGGGGSKPVRYTYITRDPDGVVRGFNPQTGMREPIKNSDAAPAPVVTQASAALPPNPQEPQLPADPANMTDDEFLKAVGVN